ncbi:hypothetical protein HHI36_015972 [Cryptolaemus montrouzieri]|uniref:Cyclic nucleotide-binding domain-containing protein n=1 Tax=Cryptolaemus montrouzieri TaxID=559131 RepID=A0ABD2N701_9CUCU
MFAPVYPMDLMVYLKNVSMASRHVLTILQGESLIGTCIAFMVHYLMVETDLGRMYTWWHYFRFLVIYFIGGILVGFISGKIMGHLMLSWDNNPIQTILISWVGPFFVYYMVTLAFGSSAGLVTLSVQGIIVAKRKITLSKETRNVLEAFWNCMALGVNSCGLLIIGMAVGFGTMKYATVEDLAFMMFGYLINLVARLLEFLSIFYFLKIIGHGIKFEHVIILVWGGILSITNLSIIMQTYGEPRYELFTKLALFHGTGATILTMVINVSTIPYLMKCLELDTISLIKQANMNKCIRHILSVRNHIIYLLKLERILCDANWPFIDEATKIEHPFKIENIKKYEELENELEFEHLALCPECHREATIVTTVKELEDLIREAKRRVLKAQKVSYSRQYETGMLPLDAIRILTNEVEAAMERDFIIQSKNILQLFKPPKHLVRFKKMLVRMFHDRTVDWFVKKPRITYRRVCYDVVFNAVFDDIMCGVIILNTVIVIAELVLRFKQSEMWNTFTACIAFKSLSFIFFIVYVIEFIMKVLALSFVYIWNDGVVGYFSSRWRKFEFFCLLISLCVVICETIESVSYTAAEDQPSGFAVFVCCLAAVRIARVARVVHRMHPIVEKCIDGRINNRITLAYSVGKGFINGEQDVIHLLPTIVLRAELTEEMKTTVEADRLAITRELGLIQRERPWVAVDVKTKKAMKTILNGMHETVTELKLMGWVDEDEREKLKATIYSQQNFVRHLGVVPTSSPRMIFDEVPWMGKDEKIVKYLWARSKTVNYEPGEYVCVENEPSEGVFIIISGLFKLSYKPDDDTLKSFYKCGNLPVIDYINSPDIDTEIEDFLLSGNTFGELCVLSQRPYSCSIAADCQSQVFFIATEFILEAMTLDCDTLDGLRARMWTSISLGLAHAILMNVPAGFGVSSKEIELSLLRAMVPDLEGVKIFLNNNMVEDIILINGVVMDFNTKVMFYAPCYIPRNVQKIVLPSSNLMNVYVNIKEEVQTKLLIIIGNDVNRNKFVSAIEQMVEYSVDFSEDLDKEKDVKFDDKFET